MLEGLFAFRDAFLAFVQDALDNKSLPGRTFVMVGIDYSHLHDYYAVEPGSREIRVMVRVGPLVTWRDVPID